MELRKRNKTELRLIESSELYSRELMLVELRGDRFFIKANIYKDWTYTLSTGDFHVHKATEYTIDTCKIPESLGYLPVISSIEESMASFLEYTHLYHYIQYNRLMFIDKPSLTLIKGEK